MLPLAVRGPMDWSSYPRSGIVEMYPRPVPPIKKKSIGEIEAPEPIGERKPYVELRYRASRVLLARGMYHSDDRIHLWKFTLPGRNGPPESSAYSESVDPVTGKIGLSTLLREMICVMLVCVVTPTA